jgi:tetratricopeptide (TPR) repeat protein
MNPPTIFLSAATLDLEHWRDLLHEAFSRAGFRVLTQKHSLGAAPGNVRRLLTEHIDDSQCVIHLAGMGYGSDADSLCPEAPEFQCSWTQFEYYYAHLRGKDVIAFVCAPDLSRPGFQEEGTAEEIARKARLQQAHRDRVASGQFDGTPLDGRVPRTLNEQVDSWQGLLKAVAAAVGTLHKLGDSAQGAVASLDLMRSLHRLPMRPPGFVGRTADLRQLRNLNPASGAILTGLRGMGGIGKTALALVLAHEWAPRFPHAQLFLDGRGTHANPPSGVALLSQVIQTFHPLTKLPDEEAQLKSIYQELLSKQRVLILLDNARDAAQVAPLIPPAGCALIVTSRHSFMLGKIAPYNVGRLLDAEAIELLREFYPALNDADAAALVKLCTGLPLALRLAGAHLALDAAERGGTANVAGYVRDLSSGRLATLDADAPDAGEVTISETLRLSEAQLSESDRTAWRQLGIFTASFDTRAAEAIVAFCSATERSFAERKATITEKLLSQFVRRSLLDRDGDRFQMHDLAGEYARSQLGEGVLAELCLTHAKHYADVGNEADKRYLNGDVVGGLALFDREREQIEAAYAGLARREDEAAARQLIDLVNAVVCTGQELRFHPRQRIAWLESQVQTARHVRDRKMEQSALCHLGNAHVSLGNASQAIEHYEQSLVIAREIGNRSGEGTILSNIGNVHTCFGDASRAIEFYGQSLVICREIGDRRREGNAFGNLGNALGTLGDARQAFALFEQSLAIAREIGDLRGEGNALGNIGIAYIVLGKSHQAIGCYEQSLVIACKIGDRQVEGNALYNSALAYDSLGNRTEGITRATAALAIYEALESPWAAKVRAQLAKWRGEGDSAPAAE